MLNVYGVWGSMEVREDLACHKGLVIKMSAVSSLTPYSKGEVKSVNSKSVDDRLGREGLSCVYGYEGLTLACEYKVTTWRGYHMTFAVS